MWGWAGLLHWMLIPPLDWGKKVKGHCFWNRDQTTYLSMEVLYGTCENTTAGVSIWWPVGRAYPHFIWDAWYLVTYKALQ
jgi:hypothetical protein